MTGPFHRREFLATAAATTIPTGLFAAENRRKTTPLPIKVGQIGVGHSHASGKWETIGKFPELFEVVGICEPDDAMRRHAVDGGGVYRDANWISEDQLLDRANLVVVETDVPDLVPTAMRAIKAGKHLHLDKPGGTNLTDFAELLKAAEARQLLIQMGYMFRYNPAFALLFQAVRDGWLGHIREVHGEIGKQADAGLRKQLAQYPGGGMFELGCHLIDAVITVMGVPTNVQAYNRSSGDDGIADNQLAILEYRGAVASIRCNHVDPFGGPRRQFSVIGEAGAIEIRPLEPAALSLMVDRPRAEYAKGVHQIRFPRGGRYDGDFQDLAAVISGAKDFQWDYAHDLTVQRALLQASGVD